MNFLDAAEVILKQLNAPLHYTDIAKRALDAGLLTTSGQTPEATMGSRLYVDTNRPDSRFRRAGRGQFELVKPVAGDEIGRRVDDINRQTRENLRQALATITAERFETLISELLVRIGFDEATIQVTPYRGDRGIDVRGDLNAGGITSIKAAVQAKKWKYNVQATVVREVRGSLTSKEQGIIITTSDFSAGAREEANAVGKTAISLINGQELIELLIKHEIGVNKQQHTVDSLDEEYWGEITEVTSPQPAAQPTKGKAVVKPPEPKAGSVTYPLTIRAKNDETKTAILHGGDGRTTFDGQEYKSPSAAGQAASGWKSCNGWSFWQYLDPATGEWHFIQRLRQLA